MSPPSLIVIAGRPGAGKTSLARALAPAVRCPAICRDELKEGLLNTAARDGDVGTRPDDDVAWQTYETFFDAIDLLLSRRVSLIAEAAFQHKLWAPKLEPLREIARVRIIVCTVDASLARARQIRRAMADPERERFHPIPAGSTPAEGEEMPIAPYDPPRLDVPTLWVDTSDGYRPSLDAIVSFAAA